jgi:hypothetical protein
MDKKFKILCDFYLAKTSLVCLTTKINGVCVRIRGRSEGVRLQIRVNPNIVRIMTLYDAH